MLGLMASAVLEPLGPATQANYAAIAGRNHAEDGRKGAEARERNKSRRRIELLERKIASGKANIAAVKLLELWRADEDYVRRVVVAESLEVRHQRETLDQVSEQVDEALAQRERVDAQLAEREAQLEAARTDHTSLVALLRECGEQRVADACAELGWLEDDEAAA